MTDRAPARDCVLCGRPRPALYFAAVGCVYRRCRGCGLIQMSPLVEPEQGDDYDGIDLDRHLRFAGLFRVPQHERAVALMRRFRASGDLLDVGCGTGEFLDVAGRAGFRVRGIDPSPTACRVAGSRHSVTCGEFEDEPLPPASFDVVTLWSVLEHAPRPSAFLDIVSSVLKEDGLIALRIPTADGLLPWLAYLLFRTTLGAIDAPLRLLYQLDWNYKHYYYFDPRNVARLLRQSGFEPLAVLRESSYDIPSLACRMDYLPKDPVFRGALETALRVILGISQLAARQDELLIIARRSLTAGVGASNRPERKRIDSAG